jgi:hypothetical protein
MPGTVTMVLSLLTMAVIFEGAAPDRLSVHVDAPGPLKLVGEQLKELNTGARRFKDAVWVTPPALAVIVTPV